MDNFILDQIISNIRIEVGHASGRNLSDPIPRSALTSASGVNALGYEYWWAEQGNQFRHKGIMNSQLDSP
ncbi:MAG: hypothetical protein JO270_02590 [Acidobacteriaceae bacterium]|nr:hypothetical protein [Acidobacteriaceae bacterium]